jgi:methylenetetrahydrofolate--tRNA-(uracil-5-)-methyltransferase
MNVNFGLFPPLAEKPRGDGDTRLRGAAKALMRKRRLSERALRDLGAWRADFGEGTQAA